MVRTRLDPTETKKAAEVWAALDALVGKYGLTTFRRVANRYLKNRRLEAKNRTEIARLEKQLAELKAKAPKKVR